jgi:beta-xylosidase
MNAGRSMASRGRGAAGVALLVAASLWLCASALASGAIRVPHAEAVAACQYAVQSGSSSAQRGCRRVEPTGTVATATVSAYQNPIYGTAPDPMAALTGATDYYAYYTGNNFPVLHSTDLVNWVQVGTALATRPTWVVASGDWHPWAPGVLASGRSCPGTTSPTCYVLYYTGLRDSPSPATNCVAAAYSTTLAGPFTDLGPLTATNGQVDSSGRPPGCGDDAGYGNIDPAPFRDSDGRTYLYVSTDRTCAQVSPGMTCPLSPTISVLPLSADLTQVVGPRVRLFSGSAGTWEQQAGQVPTVEGPWLEKRNSTYYLFYSGGAWTAAYGMGFATAISPTGPFKKSNHNPILHETSEVYSPGGGSVITGPRGGDWLIYHGRAGSYSAPRTMRIDPVVWNRNGTVAVKGPTTGPQSPAP